MRPDGPVGAELGGSDVSVWVLYVALRVSCVGFLQVVWLSHKVQKKKKEAFIEHPTRCRKSRSSPSIFGGGGRVASRCSQSGSVRFCAAGENLSLDFN